MNNRGYDHLFKLVIIGNSGVGKSSLLIRYADDKFSENYISTIGVDFKFKTFQLDGKGLKLQIWDTAGQERFRTITNSYYKGADAIVLVYDTTCLQSFEEIEKSWLDEIYKHAGRNTTILLIGNKSDLPNKTVSTERAQVYAKEKLMLFKEASAKTSLGVNQAFEELSRLLIIKKNLEVEEKKLKRNQKKNITKLDFDKKESYETQNEPKENINLWLRPKPKQEDRIQQQQCNC
ncbi:unnamed protein product (macronuclear) [Paramecium tetraurelia]|uniref:Chromosome undetermined scaffold_58, whole genome shotgun sequence n=1 Tax=Paramecium tetraurelia TaxID=5888 RepID=Q3SD16_PARTE|nr:uncharacterized protein GSPATT00018782001 [Paramecium tetraurelia]CAI44549.1 rab_B01 [Paramecium tetraurelia]CAK84586.1 unnamed protein product [Paramecium tetraurelia]|eukprot:XP_001451983.1 hypothetical protein (macronuclear) [Paramecium tetraurelia strain d4-2]